MIFLSDGKRNALHAVPTGTVAFTVLFCHR
jgi:hypothetical protein